MTLSPHLQGLRYRGTGGHVETWLLKLTEPGGRRAVYIKKSIVASSGRAPAVAEVSAIAFERDRGVVATKSTVPFETARFADDTLDIEIDGCTLTLASARGELATGERELGWDLTITSRRDPFMSLPHPRLYDASFPSSKALSVFTDARVRGELKVDRGDGPPETWAIADWPAMIGHEWGSAHPRLYAWGHCNTWDRSEELVFAAMSSRVRMGPLLSPLLTAVFVRWRGKAWALNARELFGPNRASVSMRRYELTAKGEGLAVRAELDAPTDDFAGQHAPNPSGVMTFALSAMLARARLELTLRGYSPVVATSRSAALELGTRDEGHGVRMIL